MSYRDDHDATFARLETVERDAKLLAAENQRLTAELATAKEWLGGPRRRFMLAGVMAGLCGLVFVAGLMAGRTTAANATSPRSAALASPPAAPLPSVFGIVVGDGPEVGHWTLSATRCAVRDDGVELTATGSDGHSVWVADGQVEVELPAGALRVERKHCWTRYQMALERRATTPPSVDGFVDLDCGFGDNRLQGRIEFRSCR